MITFHRLEQGELHSLWTEVNILRDMGQDETTFQEVILATLLTEFFQIDAKRKTNEGQERKNSFLPNPRC